MRLNEYRWGRVRVKGGGKGGKGGGWREEEDRLPVLSEGVVDSSRSWVLFGGRGESESEGIIPPLESKKDTRLEEIAVSADFLRGVVFVSMYS